MDIVVPFAGTNDALLGLLGRLTALDLADRDTLTVVDNRPEPGPTPTPLGLVRIVPAPERRSSYFARNRGAAAGANEWIVFIDSDTEPAQDLIDRYFERPPAEKAAIIAGGVVDRGPPPGVRRSAALLFAERWRILDQRGTLERGEWGFAKTVNCAIRRLAFESARGFRDDIRSGGDADLCFRLRAAGWQIELREEAVVIHHGRTTVAGLMRQHARWGSGNAWLNQRYPGAHPRTGLRVVPMTLRRAAGAVRAAAQGDLDGVRLRLVAILTIWAFELGRLIPNRVR